MKTKIIFIATLLMAFSLINAQSLKITYKEETTPRLGGTTSSSSNFDNLPPDMRAQIEQQINAQRNRKRVKIMSLSYRNGESLYEEIKGKEDNTPPPTSGGGGAVVMMSSSSGPGGISPIIYKNRTTNELVTQETFMDRTFLITDPLKNFNWELHDDEGIINGYKCKKATITSTILTSSAISGNTTLDEIAKLRENPESTTTTTTTAWYCPDIPISDGPGFYQGLPGLIVQIQMSEHQTITLDKIEELPVKQKIKKPTKGKKVTRDEFNKIQMQRLEQMIPRQGEPMIIQVVR
jgi:GLPGLI family protein